MVFDLAAPHCVPGGESATADGLVVVDAALAVMQVESTSGRQGVFKGVHPRSLDCCF